MDAVEHFKEAMATQGYKPDEIIPDGKIHRFATNGKSHDKAGWYVLFTNGPIPAGCFGDWRSDDGKTLWCVKKERSPHEDKAFRKAIEKAQKQREELLREEHAKARKRATNIWDAAEMASDVHLYLQSKSVKSHGLRVSKGALVIPYHDETGQLSTLQFIDQQGKKRFLKGGRKQGCYFKITGTCENIYMVEGYATGATVYEATGSTVIVCADAGNLAPVGRSIRKKYPDAHIVVAADDDQWTEGNPGITKATSAATKIDGIVLFPKFRDTASKPTDFNDLQNLEGIEAVRQQLSEPQSVVIAPDSPITAILRSDKLLAEIYNAWNRNEEGDAELIKRRYKGRLVYDHNEGTWYRFSKHHWRRDDTQKVRRVLVEISDLYVAAGVRCIEKIKAITIERARDPEDTERGNELKRQETALNNLRNEFLKRAKALRSDARAKNVLSWAAAGDPLAVVSDVWEPDAHKIGVKNGIVDLRTGELQPGQPEDFIRTFINLDFDISATCPSWEKFLMDIFAQPSQTDTLALVDYFQDLLGYTLIGIAAEPVFVVLYGKGRNGKSTLLEVVAEILGPYAHKANSELVLKKSNPSNIGAPDADTLALRHKRMVYCSETDEGRRLDANRVKHLTGNDRLQARGPYERRPTEFQPTHTLYLITNDKPQIRSDDFAIWQRVKPVPMLTSFVDNPEGSFQRKAVKDMKGRLLEEAPGILTWMVRGAKQYLTEGLTTPPVIETEAKDYRMGESLLFAWSDDYCTIEPGHDELASILFQSFNEYLEKNGYKKWSNKTFISRIEKEFSEYGVTKKKSKRGALFQGIGLKMVTQGVANPQFL